jgi:hypothetical protein
MAEIRTVTTLKGKWNEIARAIVNYENKIVQAKVDLAHINAASPLKLAQFRPAHYIRTALSRFERPNFTLRLGRG